MASDFSRWIFDMNNMMIIISQWLLFFDKIDGKLVSLWKYFFSDELYGFRKELFIWDSTSKFLSRSFFHVVYVNI